MNKRLETQKYTFSVEGETEKWYLYWLRDEINKCEARCYNVSFDVKVQPSPRKFYKNINAKTSPVVTHLCDMESNEESHVKRFRNILAEMKEAKDQKNIIYTLGYSNFTFELWIVLHKKDCNGALNDRSQYLAHINQAFGEDFENLDHYKEEDNFKRCLGKLSLNDVMKALNRADTIEKKNKTMNKEIRYKNYSYFKDNPALSIHSIVREIFFECGIA